MWGWVPWPIRPSAADERNHNSGRPITVSFPRAKVLFVYRFMARIATTLSWLEVEVATEKISVGQDST